MLRLISRRIFLCLAGGALAAPTFSWPANEVPTLLDHILLGCSDLDRGIAFVEARTGVRAAFGGVHPGRGTQNALLSLGTRRYLEIIAPDPKQSGAQQYPVIAKLTEPRLIGWAAHLSDLQSFAVWKALTLKENATDLLPFFIEWSADSMHPSADSPKGCSLLRFEAVSPETESLSKQIALLNLDIPIVKGDNPQLRATIAGPRAQFTVTS